MRIGRPTLARVAHWTHCNLTMQGYGDLSDEERRRLAIGLRVAPALCATGMAVGVALRSPVVLLAIAATALVGGFLAPKHPFDLLWDRGLRHLTGGPPLPDSPPPRRFACQLATGWLLATAILFAAGAETAGLALGIPLVAAALVVATTNWCLPSLIYGLITRRRARPASA